MTLFYSQNSEDVLLARCFEGENQGFYVDVGAEDPVEGSITRHFYERGWNGINIEPVPFFFDRLANDRPRDINLNCVASDRDDQTLNLCISEGTGLSTLEAERQEALESNPDHEVQRIEVQSQTLSTILNSHATQRIDFLKIDVEGHELAVLRGLDLSSHHPRVIVIETTLPSMHPGGRVPMQERPVAAHDFEAIDHLITAAGYRRVYFDGLNTWWIDQAEPALADAFRTPPNCFDTISPLESYRIIEQLNKRIESADAMAQNALAEGRELQRGLASAKEAYGNLLTAHQQLLNSRSWKLTGPMRRASRLSRRLLNDLRNATAPGQGS